MEKEIIYLITDTHFNHKNMVKYCNRPENFDKLIWDALDNLPKDCTLIHLGDICMGGDIKTHEHIAKLPYKKILIKGNHDTKSNKWYREHGWDHVYKSLSEVYFGKYITLSHIPIPNIDHMNIHGHFHNNLERLKNKRWVVEDEEERNREVLKSLNSNHKLLAIEYTNYRPVLLEEFIKKI